MSKILGVLAIPFLFFILIEGPLLLKNVQTFTHVEHTVQSALSSSQK